MKLTTKGRYAVTAMLDLALYGKDMPITLAEISKRQGISLSYLEQLFSRLRRQDLVTSTRGPGGGYQLSRPTTEIAVADVITAVDENVDVTLCGGQGNCHKGQSTPCLTHDLWVDLSQQIYQFLNGITLSELVARRFQKQEQLASHPTIQPMENGRSVMNFPIYLDYSATTPVDPRVAEKMMTYLTPDGHFGNPASRSHRFGWDAETAVKEARQHVADLINADPREIVWTSGATESNNLAIKGVAHFYQKKGKHIITSKTEHKAVLDTCRHLERDGFEITYMDPESNGLIDLDKLKAAIRDDTILVSLMHVNNEIGVITDIAAIGEVTRERNILFHVDAAQSAGKVDIDLEKMKVDLMSFSAHKIYGPKGMGALYVRRKPRVRLEAQMHGGGHERGMRSGTLATHQIVGMGEAFKIAKAEMAAESERLKGLRNKLLDGLKDMEEVYVNGDLDQRIAGNLNISFNYVEGESLMMALNKLAVSSGSACTSSSLEPSYVLRAIGRNDELAHSSLRFTLGRFTTEADIDYAIPLVREKIQKLRELSPLWDMFKAGIDISSIEWAAH